jgi:hypothetical protein
MYLMSRGHNALVDDYWCGEMIYKVDWRRFSWVECKFPAYLCVCDHLVAVLKLSIDWEGSMYPPASINPPPPFSLLHVRSGESCLPYKHTSCLSESRSTQLMDPIERRLDYFCVDFLKLSIDWEGSMYPPASINPPPPFSLLHVRSGENVEAHN